MHYRGHNQSFHSSYPISYRDPRQGSSYCGNTSNVLVRYQSRHPSDATYSPTEISLLYTSADLRASSHLSPVALHTNCGTIISEKPMSSPLIRTTSEKLPLRKTVLDYRNTRVTHDFDFDKNTILLDEESLGGYMPNNKSGSGELFSNEYCKMSQSTKIKNDVPEIHNDSPTEQSVLEDIS